MSTVCDLDLQENTANSVKLIQWNSDDGDDKVLIIHEDGTVERHLGEDEDGYDITEPVNLYEALCSLM